MWNLGTYSIDFANKWSSPLGYIPEYGASGGPPVPAVLDCCTDAGEPVATGCPYVVVAVAVAVAVDKLKATGCSYEVDSVAAVDVDRAVCC